MNCEIHFKNGNILKFTQPESGEWLEGLVGMVGSLEDRYAKTYRDLPISKVALAALTGCDKK